MVPTMTAASTVLAAITTATATMAAAALALRGKK